MRLATEQRGQFGKCDEDRIRLDSLNAQLAKLPEARSRPIDASTEGTLSKPEFKEKTAAPGCWSKNGRAHRPVSVRCRPMRWTPHGWLSC